MNQLAKLSNETLISLIKRKQWDAIINKCRTCSSAEYLHRESTNFNRTALSLVLTLKPPIEVVRAFVSHEAFGEALYTRDTYCDYLPIHCAVRYRASSDIVSLLIRSVDASANMLEITDRNMMTPLHIACNFGYSPRVINALVRGNPGVLKLEAKTRKTPLMLACGCKMTKPSTIKTLLAHPTRTVTGSMPNTRSCGEWTPLHLAVLHNGSLEIIQLLCDAYPEACFQKTVTSNQTPLGLYRSGHGENAEIIELLLSPTSRKCGRYYPGVIHQVLSFPQFIPGLLEFVLDNFATHAQIR
jgi:ankyrin repeat protein